VHLFTGSEGTLGVITELTLKLHPQPEAVGSATCGFTSMADAVLAVVQMIQSGVPLARMEFLDEVAVRACNQASALGLPEQPVLFLEIHGSVATVAEQSAAAQEICSANGGSRFAFATEPEQRSRLWKARHQAYFSSMALRPGSQVLVADVCVPVSELAQSIVQARREIDAAQLLAPILGHVGDGNYHVLFLLDPASADEHERAARVYDRMIDLAQRCGGTCTGEHGIGVGKRAKLLAEYGEDVVGLMRAIKTAWDPQGILNPGKIFF
jgi:D-lactate dehydrogenase (cytochrome)